MFRNQYDTDVTTFSPAGRLHQVEYALEAVKQGSCSVGLRSTTWCLVASLKRSNSELASYTQKVFKLDSHCGMAVSGLISDARVLAAKMRNECLNHRYVFESGVQLERLVLKIADQAQVYTQKAEKRPYGVGLLVCGIDKTGPHLFQTDPSGAYYEFMAQAIGARSQSAKTYLEKVYDQLEGLSRDEMIEHALRALKGASPKKLTSRNVSIGIVGLEAPEFIILEGDDIKAMVGRVTNEDDEDEPEDAKKDAAAAAAAAAETEEEKKNEEEELIAKAAADEQAREEQNMQQE